MTDTERRKYVETILSNLKRRYIERTPVPNDDKPEPLRIATLQKLHRCIMAEYGDKDE